jgi:hypothetical protein
MFRTPISAQRIALVSVSIILALTVFVRAALPQQDSETLTNADVIQLVKARLGTDAIVNQIQSQPGSYSLSTRNLIELKQAGVPDKVIEAMQAKAHRSAAPVGGISSGGAGDVTAGREYTVAEFTRLLPGILSKAAVAHGLDAHAYDKDAAYIEQTVKTCALDTSNLTSTRPDPRDPRFEICQRPTLQVSGMKDISVAAGNFHNPNSPRALGRGDLLMSTGEHAPWWPGEKQVVTVKIFMGWGSSIGGGPPELLFDDVIVGMPIKGLPPAESSTASSLASQSSGVPSYATQGASATRSAATSPVRQSDAPFNLGVLDATNITDPTTIGLLNFMRLVPHAVEDDEVLTEFIRMNNRDNPGLLAQHMSNEFDRPQIIAYYRSKMGPIAAQAPSVVTASSESELGDYDISRQAFPIVSTACGARRATCQYGWSSGDSVVIGSISRLTVGSPIAPAYRGGRVSAEADFQHFTLNWVPISEAVARQIVSAGSGRKISLITKVQILQQPPQIELFFGKSSPKFHFAGKVLSVDVIGPTNEVLATIDMSKATSGAPPLTQPAGDGPSAPTGGGAAIPVVSAQQATAPPTFAGSCDINMKTTGNGTTVRVQFINQSNADRRLYWVDQTGSRYPEGTVKAHTTKVAGSFTNWVWMVTDENKNCLLQTTLQQSGTTIVIPN